MVFTTKVEVIRLQRFLKSEAGIEVGIFFLPHLPSHHCHLMFLGLLPKRKVISSIHDIGHFILGTRTCSGFTKYLAYCNELTLASSQTRILPLAHSPLLLNEEKIEER